MKKLMIVAAASTALFATPAFAAPTASDSFDINASVAKTCAMENLNDIDLGTLSINEVAGSSALLINNNANQTGNDAWLSCNDTNAMTITFSGGAVPLLRSVTRNVTAADDAGFKDTINYRLDVNNYRSSGTQPFCYSTGPGGGGCHLVAQSRGAVHRKISFKASVLSADNQDARPLADAYTDTATVTVSTV